MANFKDSNKIKDFMERLPTILPEHRHGKYEGKLPMFLFTHPDSSAEFSRVPLRQELPGEVFQLSYPECPSGCEEHEQELRRIVQERFDHVPDPKSGALKLFFKQMLFRKQRFSNEMSVEEVVQSINTGSVKANARNQYMLDDDDKILEILKQLGAVKKNKVKKMDSLLIQFANFSFHHKYHVYLDPHTMRLSKISLRSILGKEICLIFPTPTSQTRNIFDGVNLLPNGNRKLTSDEVRRMCSESSDRTLLRILETPGLGFLSKHEDQERFVIHHSYIDKVGHLFLRKNRMEYSFTLEGVDVVFSSNSGFNHSFEKGNSETAVHQQLGRDPCFKFRRNAGLPVDTFVAVVARVISALKTAVQTDHLRLAMYEVEQRSERRFKMAVHESPSWCLRSDRQEPPVMVELRRVRDGRSLEEMLGSSEQAHSVSLRAAMRNMLGKIEEVRQWSQAKLQLNGFDPEGHDLTRLRQKVLDAGVARNLTV